MKALALVLLTGCIGRDVSLGELNPLGTVDGGDDGGASDCPNAPPSANNLCTAPEGTYCVYPAVSLQCFCVAGTGSTRAWQCSTFDICPTV